MSPRACREGPAEASWPADCFGLTMAKRLYVCAPCGLQDCPAPLVWQRAQIAKAAVTWCQTQS